MKLETFKGNPIVWTVTHRNHVEVFASRQKAIECYQSHLSFMKECGYTVTFEVNNDGGTKTAYLRNRIHEEVHLSIDMKPIIDWNS